MRLTNPWLQLRGNHFQLASGMTFFWGYVTHVDRHLLYQELAFYDSKIGPEKLWFKLQTLESEKL